MNNLLRAVPLIIFTGLAAPAALACSCERCDETMSFIEDPEIDAVFVGELVSITKPDVKNGEPEWHQADALYRFKVIRPMKGKTSKYIEVRTPESGPSCGAAFSFYSPSAVTAYSDSNGTLRTDSCTQSCWDVAKNRALITENTIQTWSPPDLSNKDD
nr:hypothetical protein [uncultured Hyphomonas sp.]